MDRLARAEKFQADLEIVREALHTISLCHMVALGSPFPSEASQPQAPLQPQLDASISQLRQVFPNYYLEYVGALGLCVGVTEEYFMKSAQVDRDYRVNQTAMEAVSPTGLLAHGANLAVVLDEELQIVRVLKHDRFSFNVDMGLRIFTPDSKGPLVGPTLWDRLLED